MSFANNIKYYADFWFEHKCANKNKQGIGMISGHTVLIEGTTP